MRNFFLFLIRHYAAFMFAFLQLIAMWMVFQNNAYHNTWFVNSANKLTGNVLNTYGNLTMYFTLKSVNDSLVNENALLRATLLQSKQFDTVNHYEVKDTVGTIIYQYIPAEVISNVYTELNNYITINRGSKHGIEPEMGVITANGIVGKVVSVSENFSVIMPILNADFNSAVALKKNNGLGSLRWRGGDPSIAIMENVAEGGLLQQNDTVITTAVSSKFPPGTMVGTVLDYTKDAEMGFYTLTIKLTTKFSSLHYVYVVNYLRKEEKSNLEKAVNNADN